MESSIKIKKGQIEPVFVTYNDATENVDLTPHELTASKLIASDSVPVSDTSRLLEIKNSDSGVYSLHVDLKNDGSQYVNNRGGGNLDSNTAFGQNAGIKNTTGIGNTFIGAEAGAANTTGNDNTIWGSYAGIALTTGSQNLFAGNGAGRVAVATTGNTFVGSTAGRQQITGNSCTGVGRDVFRFMNGGQLNTAFGEKAGYNLSTGSENNLSGRGAGFDLTTGIRNTIIGPSFDAGTPGIQGLVTGSYNTYLGRVIGRGAAEEYNVIIADGANNTLIERNGLPASNPVNLYGTDLNLNGVSLVVPNASSSTAGKAKLYTSLGTNTDGSIDQNTANTNFAAKANLAGGNSFTGNQNMSGVLTIDGGVASSPYLNVTGFAPGITQVIQRSTNSTTAAVSLTKASLTNTTSGLTTDIAFIGALANTGTSPSAPAPTYMYLGSASTTAFNDNAIRIYPTKAVSFYGAVNLDTSTASRVLVTDASKNVTTSSVTSTELGYLSGATSSLQTQINSKQATLVSGTNIKTVGGQSLLGSGNVTEVQNSMTASTTLAPSVTAANAALDLKADIANPTFTGVVTSPAFKLSALQTAPANATDTGTTGEIRVVADYIYVCVATNTWVRTPLTTW